MYMRPVNLSRPFDGGFSISELLLLFFLQHGTLFRPDSAHEAEEILRFLMKRSNTADCKRGRYRVTKSQIILQEFV